MVLDMWLFPMGRAPGQGFTMWENFHNSFIIGIVFFLLAEICGLIATFSLGGNPLIHLFVIPIVVYLIGSFFLFMMISIARY